MRIVDCASPDTEIIINKHMERFLGATTKLSKDEAGPKVDLHKSVLINAYTKLCILYILFPDKFLDNEKSYYFDSLIKDSDIDPEQLYNDVKWLLAEEAKRNDAIMIRLGFIDYSEEMRTLKESLDLEGETPDEDQS